MDRPFLTLPRLPVQFPLSTDSVLLADFAVLPRKHARVADLGAGIGTLGLLLCQKDPSCRVDGLELQPGAAALAPAVIRENGMEGRISVYPGDLRDAAAYLPRGGYDLVVSNPPYFPAGSGAQAGAGPGPHGAWLHAPGRLPGCGGAAAHRRPLLPRPPARAALRRHLGAAGRAAGAEAPPAGLSSAICAAVAAAP